MKYDSQGLRGNTYCFPLRKAGIHQSDVCLCKKESFFSALPKKWN